jgi:hypothetical protein
MKNSSDTIGNRSHDLSVCIAVPQPLRHRVPLYCNGPNISQDTIGGWGACWKVVCSMLVMKLTFPKVTILSLAL